jgi:hypothetical protein
MSDTERQLRIGIVILVLAGMLLVGPNVVSLPFSDAISAVAVLGLAAGAALVGTAEEGRPV